eukprot:6985428-Prymnesium_polylepis.1
MNARTRLLLEGHALVGPEARTVIESLQDENWRLRVQIAHLQGDSMVGRKGHGTFQPPTRQQSQAANRQSRRTLQRIEAHLYATWEELEAADADWWS